MSSEQGGKSGSELAMERTGMAGDRTRWSADRTLWAADRTFIAWLRTAISLIGFGFGLGKAGDALREQEILVDKFHSLQAIGLAFIILSILGLIGALIQNVRIGNRLARQGYGRVEPTPLAQVMGFLVLAIGVAGAVFIVI